MNFLIMKEKLKIIFLIKFFKIYRKKNSINNMLKKIADTGLNY